MSERPYVSFAEVKQKVSIPDVLDILGHADEFTDVNGTLTGVCPLPEHQHGPQPNREQFKINQKNGVWLWHCFGDCQRGGDVIELVKAILGYDNAHVRFWFAEHFADRLTLSKPKPKEQPTSQTSDAPPPESTSQPSSSSTVNSTDAVEATAKPTPPLKLLRFFLNLDHDVPYLRDRGLKKETILRYGLGLCRKGFLAGYVAIPIFDYPKPLGSHPVGYLGRWPGEPPSGSNTPRYKFPADFPRNRVVYGLPKALDGIGNKPLIVVEGPFKVFHLYQAGFPNTVATFGANMSDEQAMILAETKRPLILMFDGDEAGQAGMRSAAERLIERTFVKIIKLPDGKHPDDLSPTELTQLLS